MQQSSSIPNAILFALVFFTDLSNAKDYHRRHKVCDVHSKATKALVGNVMQRFCQQCSRGLTLMDRFHALRELDEVKRSCCTGLAGHNRRRRKMHPDTAVNGGSLNNESGSSYPLISLPRILSNSFANCELRSVVIVDRSLMGSDYTSNT
ncbi:hypothetical protein C1H46_020455 [Malus baccata]|uniref:SBP-type domain-containing protein n=1 Tax=Malus baccata TaxID=106549 RepID=A0A540M5E7_MALBA|nr:hypothetical protein C1H46_020455 [Malus baccata]